MAIQFTGGLFLQEDGELLQKEMYVHGNKVYFTQLPQDVEIAKTIDITGKLVTPGLIDVHIHLREPGGEEKETIETGTMAAAAGGFTTVAAMPNTNPVPDRTEHMKQIQQLIKEKAKVRVLPYASITVEQRGENLVDFASLKKEGAFAFTDDGFGIQTAGQMYEAMKEAAALQMAIVAHCEDNSLLYGGYVHEGSYAKKHELKGILSVSESVHIARDVLLAEATGVHYHVCHISTKESVRVVRDAKKAGISVTAEVSPHHLLLCEDDISGLDPNYKMNPPLRAKEDQEALWEGLLDGTIDFIATDHAPHTEEEKALGMEKAPLGIVGLETAFPLLYTHIVKSGKASLKQLIDWLTIIPAKTFGLPMGSLYDGAVADIAIFDLDEKAPIQKEQFFSKGKNTPFDGWSCYGWPLYTLVDGKIVFDRGEMLK